MTYSIDISSILSDAKFAFFQSLGLIDKIALRNLAIRTEYHQLKESLSQYEAKYFLADKYNLSLDTINTILYRPRNLKKYSGLLNLITND